ncbi:MAG: hypothetical protein M1836_005806 [Candelina mexicana]|nr:MAG: hypothetical protein M1836_005806 [Candelina mexicana]
MAGAAALNMINVIGVGLMAADLAKSFASKPLPEEYVTNVQIGIGTGLDSMQGNCPNVNVYTKEGLRAGQSKSNEHLGGKHETFKASKAKKVWINEKDLITLRIENTQLDGGAKQIEPHYLKLTMFENDAPCIASVSAASAGVSWGWFGDSAKVCGAQWYHSNKIFGDSTYQPSCIYMDRDFSKGIYARGMSMHMPDFGTGQAVGEQYKNNPDLLCKSAKRMTMYHDTEPDGGLRLRFPKDWTSTAYNLDGTDKFPDKVIDNKATFNDPNTSAPSPKVGKFRRDGNSTTTAISNNQEGHLVISESENHSAKELCEHPNSLGPDFVSTEEGIFCDMTAKEYWFLCSATLKTGCFDVDKKEMVGGKPGIVTRDLETGRVIPEKKYESHNHWKRDEWRWGRVKRSGWKRAVFDMYHGHWPQ